MKTRTYNQLCGLAYALDVVGERWTLLIVRELIAGPRRFKDLIEGLPDISTNLLSERLKNLEEQGVIRRRVLPPPAGSTVYELTERGFALEPMLLELGKWGSQFVPPSHEGVHVLRPGSYALTPKTFFRPEEANGVDDTLTWHIDDEVLRMRVHDNTLDVEQGDNPHADVTVHTNIMTYLEMLLGGAVPEEAIASGAVTIEGDRAAVDRFLTLCQIIPPTP